MLVGLRPTGSFLASHDIELLQISDETDDVILLLSTDWFSTWMFSLGQWRGGQASLALTKDVARRAASDILSGSTDCYLVDLSPTRKAATFDRFMKELRPCLDEKGLRDICRLVDSITGQSLLSRDQRWALKAAVFPIESLDVSVPMDAAFLEQFDPDATLSLKMSSIATRCEVDSESVRVGDLAGRVGGDDHG